GLGLLVPVVIGGIVLGWITASEAAAVGAAGALLICSKRGKLDRASLRRALEETLRTSGLIYLVVIGALIFAAFIAVTGLADAIGNLIVGLGLGPVATMALVA